MSDPGVAPVGATDGVAGPLWTPASAADTQLDAFRRRVAGTGIRVDDSVALHEWSIAHPGPFWRAVWDACGVMGEPGDVAFDPGDGSIVGGRFFPAGRLNFAENLLHSRNGAAQAAIVSVGEAGDIRRITRDELRRDVAAMAAALRASGVGVGDRVAAWMPNVPETVVTMLATTALGAVFSSTSADFGVAGVVDRFAQINPKVLVAADGYTYGGQQLDCLDRLATIRDRLPSLVDTVVAGHLADEPDLRSVPGAITFAAYVAPWRGAPLQYNWLPFDQPAFVLYSSGTTGPPKGIVHRAGGVLLTHLKEHRLHCDIRAGDIVFYFTTCGWMMWNWLTSALATGATIVLYDGHPMHPRPARLYDLVDGLGVSFFGTSAKYLDASRKGGMRPGRTHSLEHLRTIASTGSPLSVDAFEYVYAEVKRDVHLASISGGTDLCGCFVAGDPTRPVWPGEIQGPALGMAVDVFDEDGGRLVGGRGELVCTRPFPSQPLGFWGDDEGSRYRAAYYERFPGVWTHGDFAAWTSHGGIVISGRSDTTLNASGVRIGTAEIYREVEAFDEVEEAITVAQDYDDDTRMVMFVRMRAGHRLDEELIASICRRLRRNCSPRHVPALVLEVDDIPRTRSGKISELAVADVVNGRPVRNVTALANPDALAEYRDRTGLD